MVGLLDISPVTKEVPIDGDVSVEVQGLTLAGLAAILHTSKDLRDMFQGKADFSVESIFNAGPDLVARFIAAGVGQAENKAYVDRAKSLGVGMQTDLLVGIMDLTFPKGVGPFVEALTRLMAPGQSIAAGIKGRASN